MNELFIGVKKGKNKEEEEILPEPPCEDHDGIMVRPEIISEEYRNIRSKCTSKVCPACGWEILTRVTTTKTSTKNT